MRVEVEDQDAQLAREVQGETIDHVVPGESGTDKRVDIFRKRNFVTRSFRHLLAQYGIYLF